MPNYSGIWTGTQQMQAVGASLWPGPPGAPTSVSATATGTTSASVSFTPPSFLGVPTLTTYTVVSSPGNLTASGASSPISITGLTTNTSYTFTVYATNTAGNGPSSSPSASITTLAVPGAPTSVSASAGAAQATVSFTAPSFAGVPASITGYRATSSPGGITATGASSPIIVTGLTPGTPYTFTVAATNSAGYGAESSASNSVTPTSADLYSFTTFTFTNAGQTGYTGPTKAQCLSSYNTVTYPWLNNTAYFNVVTQGIQLWTVPATGSYLIDATGARGGSSGFGPGGYGARIRTIVSLTKEQVLAIVVGQSGEDNNLSTNFSSGPGGGGGTFIYDNSSITYYVAVAGGGGALTSTTNLTSTQTDAHGKASTTAGTSITDAGGFVSLGGTGGQGGGISNRNVLYGGAGAGVFSAGAAGNGSYPGQSRSGNWLGGAATYVGGFGGGGSSFGEIGYTQYKWGGGGGGYSGGACGHNGGNSDGQYGGGGGSYYIGSLQTATDGYQNGMGYVTITKL